MSAFLDQNLLQSALQSATSLRQLILHNIASDSILGVIGRSCPNLTHLDVAHSRQVTDAGMRQLFLQIELRDKNPLASKYSHSLARRNPLSAWSRLRNLFRLVFIYLYLFTSNIHTTECISHLFFTDCSPDSHTIEDQMINFMMYPFF